MSGWWVRVAIIARFRCSRRQGRPGFERLGRGHIAEFQAGIEKHGLLQGVADRRNHIERIVHDLDPSLVQVLVTLRPVRRLLPSWWQQLVQGGLRLDYEAWLEEIYRDMAVQIRDLMELLRGEGAP